MTIERTMAAVRDLLLVSVATILITGMSTVILLPIAMILKSKPDPLPFVITTWAYTNSTQIAWDVLTYGNGSTVDAVERGCNFCEHYPSQCRGWVGFGHEPDESGEVTLDAMIMDGDSHLVGGVGCLRRVKEAISVARAVMERTTHTLLVGDLATRFAIENGFKEENLSTDNSNEQWMKWKANNCQPNFRMNVTPDPSKSCGPYTPTVLPSTAADTPSTDDHEFGEDNHDTIGMVVVNARGSVAVGTSTNGLNHKLSGRVGDSPIAGAGAYADSKIGGAAATGNGDTMMRFLPSYQAVESMRLGMKPREAAEDALTRIKVKFSDFKGAIIVANVAGDYGVACAGYDTFPYVIHSWTEETTQKEVTCFI